MGVTLSYLAGVYLSVRFVLPAVYTTVLCALLLVIAALRLARRKGALLYMCGVFLLLGNLRAGCALSLFDMPTASRAHIEGTVAAIEREHRVVLRDVLVEGERTLSRHAVVTLMPPEDEKSPIAETPKVGQRIEGVGRLFAPDTPRNPGGVNWRYSALTDGYELSGYLLDGWKAEGEARFSIRECFRQARVFLLDAVERLFGERAALYQGIMLGDKRELDEALKQSLQLTGTAHILTVSGLHLGMIAAVAGMLLEKTTLRRGSRFVCLGAFLAVFTGLTGCAAGTVRAMIMALMRELARIRGRRYEPLTSLSAAALLMTLIHPVWALDVSFQFSFFVVLGIILLSGGVAGMRSRRAQTLSPVKSAFRALLSAIGVSLCAQISAIPMQLLFYGYVPLLSLPMNLLCGALMPFLMLGGWLSLVIGLFAVPLGRLAACIASLPALVFEWLSVYAASFSHAIVRLPAPHAVSVFLFALLMMLLSRRIRFGSRRRAAVFTIALLVLATYIPRFDPQARYVQLDVGQGDASLFRKGRKAVIVDVGPEDSYELLRYLRHEGLFVEAVVLSHLDQDHAGALGLLLESEIRVPFVIMPVGAEAEKPAGPVEAALALMKDKGVARHEVRRGDALSFGALDMVVLAPDSAAEERNDDSLVLHARLEGVTFLMTGDLPSSAEPDNLPQSDVLKVAHHGSRSSTSKALLEQVCPKLSLISVGAGNWYKHPSKEVLSRLEKAGSAVLRTDERGCITLRLKDGLYKAACFLSE